MLNKNNQARALFMRNNLSSTNWTTAERKTNFLMTTIVKNFNSALAQITGDRVVVVIV